MIDYDIQVSKSKVKVKVHFGLLLLVQLITEECFVLDGSFLVGW